MVHDSWLPAPECFVARGGNLRSAALADADFMRDVYVAGRWDEMQASGWPAPLIVTFLRDQCRLQTLHYEKHYPDANWLVIECDGALAGRLILLETAAEIRVVDIGLMPEFRGRGIGGMLIAWVQENARAHRRPKVSLHVESNNPAKRLYNRLGFKFRDVAGVYELMEWESIS